MSLRYYDQNLLNPLKLVLLEWSESKSDGKFGFNMLKTPLCNFSVSEQSEQPVAFDSIL